MFRLFGSKGVGLQLKQTQQDFCYANQNKKMDALDRDAGTSPANKTAGVEKDPRRGADPRVERGDVRCSNLTCALKTSMSTKNNYRKSSLNGKPAHPDRAKWVLESSQSIPPVAFAVPVLESERLPLTAAAEREDGDHFNAEDFARIHGGHAVKARYAGKSAEFRAEAESQREKLARLEDERTSLLAVRENHQPNLIKVKKALQFPTGALKFWMILCCVVAAVLIGVEWSSAASFAALGEMQNWWRALAFTMGMAVAPVAAKLVENKALRTVIIIAGLAFIFAYSFAYVPADQGTVSSSDEVLRRAAMNQNTQSEPVWNYVFDPRLRVAWQYIFSALVVFAISSWIAGYVAITTEEESEPNLVFEALTAQIVKIEEEMAEVRLKLARAEGDQEEAASSLWLCQEERVAIVRAARYRKQESKEVLRYLTERVGRWDPFTHTIKTPEQ